MCELQAHPLWRLTSALCRQAATHCWSLDLTPLETQPPLQHSSPSVSIGIWLTIDWQCMFTFTFTHIPCFWNNFHSKCERGLAVGYANRYYRRSMWCSIPLIHAAQELGSCVIDSDSYDGAIDWTCSTNVAGVSIVCLVDDIRLVDCLCKCTPYMPHHLPLVTTLKKQP